MYGANSSNRILKTALGDATFAEARSLGRRASPCFAASAFQDSPLSFMPFTPNTQRYQCVRFSPSRRAWEPPVQVPASSAAPSPTWVGNPRAAAPRVRTKQRPPWRCRRRQEPASVTPASPRPRRHSCRPWRSAQRAPAAPSTEGGRLLGPLFSGI